MFIVTAWGIWSCSLGIDAVSSDCLAVYRVIIACSSLRELYIRNLIRADTALFLSGVKPCVKQSNGIKDGFYSTAHHEMMKSENNRDLLSVGKALKLFDIASPSSPMAKC